MRFPRPALKKHIDEPSTDPFTSKSPGPVQQKNTRLLKEEYYQQSEYNGETGNNKSCLRIFVRNDESNFFHNLILVFK